MKLELDVQNSVQGCQKIQMIDETASRADNSVCRVNDCYQRQLYLVCWLVSRLYKYKVLYCIIEHGE